MQRPGGSSRQGRTRGTLAGRLIESHVLLKQLNLKTYNHISPTRVSALGLESVAPGSSLGLFTTSSFHSHRF